MKYHRDNKKTARKRFPNKQRMKVIAGCMALCIVLLGESCIPVSAAQNKKDLKKRKTAFFSLSKHSFSVVFS